MDVNEQLIKAAKAEDLKAVKTLLDRGADIHARNDEALRSAAHNGYLEIVQLLLEMGANYRNQKTRKFLKGILWIKRLPSSREKLINMLKVAIIHRE